MAARKSGHFFIAYPWVCGSNGACLAGNTGFGLSIGNERTTEFLHLFFAGAAARGQLVNMRLDEKNYAGACNSVLPAAI
jgi:hypothetical protein